MTDRLDERAFLQKGWQENQNRFLRFIEQYERDIAPLMRKEGYTCKNRSQRTVLFPFGEMTFFRSRWYKGKVCRIPLDEKLGLKKHMRYSRELLYQVAHLATYMPYRKVVEVVELTYGLYITKDTVNQAVKLAGTLLKDREDYRFFEEAKPNKSKPSILYIEGDGVMVKARDKNLPNRNMDLSHFIIHEGSQKIASNRYQLRNKKEFVFLNNHKAREAVLDYLHNHYDITEDTLFITNSDGGHGYTPYVFKELAKAFQVQRHEHFWDAYHVYQGVKDFLRPYPEELLERSMRAIEQHDKQALKVVMDTVESYLTTEEEFLSFDQFKRRLLANFQYTRPPKARGLSSAGIGIMESQHRKIVYRMKKRGMYWSRRGAEVMSQLILLREEKELRDLFFGDWREKYEYYKGLDTTVSDYLDLDHDPPDYHGREVKVNKPIRLN